MSSQFSYIDVMMNMKILAVITQPSIYHGCSTRKTFWKEKFRGEEKLFSSVNIKIVVVAMLGNTGISRVVKSMSPWKSHSDLTFCTI